MYLQGQYITGCIPFKDGAVPVHRRPYLVVYVDREQEELHILTISSVVRKEHKLKFPTNILLNYSMPPLIQPSFVKIDSCQRIAFQFADRECKLMSDGALMQTDDLNAVIDAYKKYIEK